MKSGSWSPQLEKAPQSSEDPAQLKINFKKEKKKKTSQKDKKKKKSKENVCFDSYILIGSSYQWHIKAIDSPSFWEEFTPRK